MKSISNKVVLFICIILISLLTNNQIYADDLEDNNSIDTKIELYIPGTECLPDNFRKSTDNIPNKNLYKDINTTGLNTLNISGSSQFSHEGFNTLIKSIGENYKIIDIDLRQESHGFINGEPINWPHIYSSPESTLQEITAAENKKLNSISINKPVTYSNLPCKTVIPKIVINEETFIKEKNMIYMRFPVIDGSIPTQEIVDKFIDFLKNQPENSWLHFHCKAGIGRTTTFMTMYDIYKNGKTIPLEDIINRQVALAKMGEDEKNSFLSQKRIEFLTNFYNKFSN